MAFINRPSLPDIQRQFTAALRARLAPELRDQSETSVLGALNSATSTTVSALYQAAENAFNLAFPTETTGEFLDLWSTTIGVQRLSATSSRGTVNLRGLGNTSFTLLTSDLFQAPNGTRFAVEADTPVSYTAQGTAQVTVVSLERGANTNIPANEALSTSSSNIISATSGTMTGGADTEGDDALRTRFLQAFRNPPSVGTEADYIRWCTEVQGCNNAFILSRTPGTVNIYPVFPENNHGIASESNLEAVREHLETNYRPAGVELAVFATATEEVDVTISRVSPYNETNDALIRQVVESVFEEFTGIGDAAGTVLFQPRLLANAIAALDQINVFDIAAPSTGVVLPFATIPIPGTIIVRETA